ncbi:PAS domain S-box protein [Bacillus sp. Marseille-P3661]|uniref:PAS domain S-box protein n=1 Tax=Bacillus sp. Marseille-P3661 TaxID=1936234 RepID=UPI000C865A4F|nr:PAS domain S-box protein [Bacillus sp. Marseille-P3661]
MKQFVKRIGKDVLAFSSLFDFMKDLIILVEIDGDSYRYVYVNQSAASVLSYDGGIYGQRIEDVVPKGRAELLKQYFKEVQTTKKSVEYIESIETKNGTFIGESSLGPIITEDGDCQYILAITRDVTEKMQKEMELLETKRTLEKEHKRLTSLVENNDDAVFELDLMGNFTSSNAILTQITGYSEQDLIGSSFVPLIDKEYLNDTLSHFERALAGINEEYETCIQNSHGEKIYLLVTNMPINIDGMLDGIYGIARDITERRRMERLLEESEQRYKSLFENHPDAIFSYDLYGNFTSGNAGVERISGYSSEEFLGKSFIPMMVPEDVDKTLYHFNKAIQDKKTESYEVALRHKAGHRVELFVMSIPIIVNDDVVGIYGLAKDVTETKQAQKALIETKEELEVFWKYTVDPVFFINTKGDILKVNPAFEKTFGFSEDEIVVQKCTIVPVNLKIELLEISERISNGEIISTHQTKRITKHGELLDIISSYTPVRDESGNIIGATAFYKNVTEHKRAERELIKSQEKYRLITDNAFDIINIINPNGIIEFVSPSNEKILGYPTEDCIGTPFLTHVHPEDLSLLEREFRRLLAGGEPCPVEFRVWHRNGQMIWMEANTTPVIEDGEVKQLVTIARDITERKKLRDELEKAAFYDFLSGLPNRRTFDDRLEMAIHHANRSGQKVAVMMLDGRKFKQINDTYGHDAGDAVIKEMARRLQKCVRKTDTVARLGGDEMGIILPELTSVETAEDIARRIIKAFEEAIDFNHVKINLGAGIGISLYPDHSNDKRQLVKFADMALYDAKQAEHTEYKIYK